MERRQSVGARARGARGQGRLSGVPVSDGDPGVATATFLRAAVNSSAQAAGARRNLTTPEFLKRARAGAARLSVADDMLKRPLNVGFSGGEKKRMEILQMAILEPTLCVMDETDSGPRYRCGAGGVGRREPPQIQGSRHADHHPLSAIAEDYIVPDRVHVMAAGKIQKSGGKELALELEKDGIRRVPKPGGLSAATVQKK